MLKRKGSIKNLLANQLSKIVSNHKPETCKRGINERYWYFRGCKMPQCMKNTTIYRHGVPKNQVVFLYSFDICTFWDGASSKMTSLSEICSDQKLVLKKTNIFHFHSLNVCSLLDKHLLVLLFYMRRWCLLTPICFIWCFLNW